MDITHLPIIEPQWNDDYEKHVNNPFNYLKDQTEGKNLRKLLIKTFNLIHHIPEDDLSKLSDIINNLHLSSLIIDDIEDDSKLRRGKPCSHLIFGIPSSINSSNYTYFKSMQLLNDFFKDDSEKNFKAQQIFMDEMINLHRGQGLDLYWRDNSICPDESEYVGMVMNKTGGLFRLSIKLLNLLADHEDYVKLVELSNLLGLIYQIKDDYLNLKSREYNSNKGFCEDITEGKFSFPIIHSIHSESGKGNNELASVLRLHTHDVELKRYCVEVMETSGSFEYSLDTIDKLKKRTVDLIDEMLDEYIADEKERNLTRGNFLSALYKIVSVTL